VFQRHARAGIINVVPTAVAITLMAVPIIIFLFEKIRNPHISFVFFHGILRHPCDDAMSS